MITRRCARATFSAAVLLAGLFTYRSSAACMKLKLCSERRGALATNERRVVHKHWRALLGGISVMPRAAPARMVRLFIDEQAAWRGGHAAIYYRYRGMVAHRARDIKHSFTS